MHLRNVDPSTGFLFSWELRDLTEDSAATRIGRGGGTSARAAGS